MRSKEDWMAIINVNARRLVAKGDFSAEQISNKSGIHLATISQLRNNTAINPQLSTLVSFSHAVDGDVDDLFLPNSAVARPVKKYVTFSGYVADKFWLLMKEFEIKGDDKEMRIRFDHFFKSIRTETQTGLSEEDEVNLFWRDVLVHGRQE